MFSRKLLQTQMKFGIYIYIFNDMVYIVVEKT